MARSQLTETINRVAGMVTYVRDNLSVEEYDLFLDMVAPQPEPEPAAKKTRKKRTTKSAKAQSLSSVIAKTPKVEAIDSGFMEIGSETDGPKCGTCGNAEDYQDHFRPSPNYHPFDAPAQPAEKKSKKKAAAASGTQNSEIEKGAAMSASGD